jgi:hypothetical protein
MNGKALCLICNESNVVLKGYDIARHYNLKRTEMYKNCVGAMRTGKMAALERGLESQQVQKTTQ